MHIEQHHEALRCTSTYRKWPRSAPRLVFIQHMMRHPHPDELPALAGSDNRCWSLHIQVEGWRDVEFQSPQQIHARFQTGDIILRSPGHIKTRILRQSVGPNRSFTVLFDHWQAEPAIAQLPPGHSQFMHGNIEFFVAHIQRMLAAAMRIPPETAFWLGQSGLCAMLAQLQHIDMGKKVWQLQQKLPLPQQRLSDSALDWIFSTPVSALSAQDCAVALNVAPAHLSRAFRKETGNTLQMCIQKRRMDIFRELLERGATIEDLAAQFGFASLEHCKRLMKRWEL